MIADEILSPDLEPGIDMMAIHTPIRGFVAPPQDWQTYNHDLANDKTWATAIWPLKSGQVKLNANLGTQSYALIEFNPSKILFGGWRLASLSEAETVFDEVMGLVQEWVEPSPLLRDYKLNRIDAARDFAPVVDILGLLRLAERSKPFKSKNPCTYIDRDSGAPQTVTFSTKRSGCLQFYDKGLETGLGGDWLRIEHRIKGRDLKKFGLKNLSDLSVERLSAAFRSRLRRFCALCGAHPQGAFDEIAQEPSQLRTLVNLLGRDVAAESGREIPMSAYDKRNFAAFEKRWPYVTARDLLA
jgi:hypothetical protein